jgi:F-type H+/Na+-transporting ATPase subunit alpha
MALKIDDIAASIRQQIEAFDAPVETIDVGRVNEIGDGVARVSGLMAAMQGELLEFPENTMGIALNLEANQVGAVIVGDYTHIEEGDLVKSTGRIASVPVSDDLMGRVVDALGRPIDGKGPIRFEDYYPVERIAPGVVYRDNVDTPVQTGLKAIDSMIPIGRGQRELIIGDRQTGKTALAVDTIINQKGKDLICIYVAIGQKRSSIAQVVATLKEHAAMDHTIIVVASASDPAAMQYIAPYSGCAMGEYFMHKGQDALVVYDDLSKHAWAYRQMSLILRRPPGREAYPGDLFYLHSRLLERAARMSKEQGGGSLTALPVIETLAADVSAYVPTNVISITDGQIYLESDLFYAGQRPAVNAGLSVSRVGGDAQTKIMKKIAGQLRLDLAQFRELAAFAQFGSDLDKATRAQLERGRRLMELLKQPQYQPLELEDQVIGIFALTQGLGDKVPVEKIGDYEQGLIQHVHHNHPDLIQAIRSQKELSEAIETGLQGAIEAYNSMMGY